ncbi:hypothetical protein C8R43DRAFT_943086 [Mycena crocata]|nr:hypothetical protein C8R43DRAFT_943086 [Mycena crocata]
MSTIAPSFQLSTSRKSSKSARHPATLRQMATFATNVILENSLRRAADRVQLAHIKAQIIWREIALATPSLWRATLVLKDFDCGVTKLGLTRYTEATYDDHLPPSARCYLFRMNLAVSACPLDGHRPWTILTEARECI